MYSVFEDLLKKTNKTTYRVSKDTGISQSVFSAWKTNRSTPKQDKLQKIADYFNVTIEYLMTGEDSSGEKKYYLNDETAEIAQRVFEDENLRVLFDAAKNASPEDIQATYNVLLALKNKERHDE
jgi:transcriptional regulator with XRE-family HTH domain